MPIAPSSANKPHLNAVLTHFNDLIVPLWQGPGWNAELALPYEALDADHRPLPPQRYRAMACARQLYVFASLIGELGQDFAEERAAALFRSLQRHFHDAEHGGWFYSIDPHGKPLDKRKDLYTHAFIIFACAHYWAKVREPLVESVLNAALEVVAERFATGDGLYEAVVSVTGHPQFRPAAKPADAPGRRLSPPSRHVKTPQCNRPCWHWRRPCSSVSSTASMG